MDDGLAQWIADQIAAAPALNEEQADLVRRVFGPSSETGPVVEQTRTAA